jgi:hypothetical protein
MSDARKQDKFRICYATMEIVRTGDGKEAIIHSPDNRGWQMNLSQYAVKFLARVVGFNKPFIGWSLRDTYKGIKDKTW